MVKRDKEGTPNDINVADESTIMKVWRMGISGATRDRTTCG